MGKAKNSILVVDNDARNIFALNLVLRSREYPILSAPDARMGINLLRENKNITVVFPDMMMPDMAGYQAIAMIRKEEELQTVAVIAVTAQAMQGDRKKCLRAGADGYISKPIDMDQLQVILVQYV